MDQTTKRAITMLQDADKKMLYANKWKKYDCASAGEAQACIDALLSQNAVRKLPTKTNAVYVDGKPVITFSEAVCYGITDIGRELLALFLSEA